MEKASIRTYTPRGQKNPGATKDRRAVVLFKDEKDYSDVPQIQSFIQEAYDMALSLKGKEDSDSSLKAPECHNFPFHQKDRESSSREKALHRRFDSDPPQPEQKTHHKERRSDCLAHREIQRRFGP